MAALAVPLASLLLFLVIPQAGGSEGAALNLLALFLVVPVLVAWALDGLLFRRAGIMARGLVALTASAAAVFILAQRCRLDPGGLGFWSLGPFLLALAGQGFGALLGLQRARILCALGLPTLALFAPFMADAWLSSQLPIETLQSGVDSLLRLSAWPGSCAELLEVDLFKNASLYREFRLGEQLYSVPAAGSSLAAQAILALGILFLGLIVRGTSRVLIPALSRSRRCASIAQP